MIYKNNTVSNDNCGTLRVSARVEVIGFDAKIVYRRVSIGSMFGVSVHEAQNMVKECRENNDKLSVQATVTFQL